MTIWEIFFERFFVVEHADEIVIRFAHFPTVDSRKGFHGFFHVGRRLFEDLLSVCFVEGAGDVARHFEVLDLVFSYRNDVGVVGENVGRHEDGIREGCHVEIEPFASESLKLGARASANTALRSREPS